MSVASVFHGDAIETRDLMRAIDHNCSCETNDGLVSGDCPAHRAMLDQRWLNGLLFARYMTERLLVEEFR